MTWVETQARRLTGGRDEVCFQAHGEHGKQTVDTTLGPMLVYRADDYRNVYGFCPADDVVSATLADVGFWERANEEAIVKHGVLDGPAPGEVVIDVGCQVGWYTRMAAQAGFRVLAIDAVAESLGMALTNGGPNVTGCRAWIDADTPEADPEGAPPVRLVKMDIEGSEEHALRVVWPLIDAGLVDHLLVELSPVFNDSYPALVEQIRAVYPRAWLSYRGEPWDWRLDFDQAEVLFSR